MVGTLLFPLEMNGHLFKIKKMEVLSGSETRMDLDLQIIGLKRQIDHRLATHFHPAALLAQIAEVGQIIWPRWKEGARRSVWPSHCGCRLSIWVLIWNGKS